MGIECSIQVIFKPFRMNMIVKVERRKPWANTLNIRAVK